MHGRNDTGAVESRSVTRITLLPREIATAADHGAAAAEAPD
jgi:hypothetical protein